jgi:hypothetical protein
MEIGILNHLAPAKKFGSVPTQHIVTFLAENSIGTGKKIEIPTTKIQAAEFPFGNLEFGHWDFFGIWPLGHWDLLHRHRLAVQTTKPILLLCKRFGSREELSVVGTIFPAHF